MKKERRPTFSLKKKLNKVSMELDQKEEIIDLSLHEVEKCDSFAGEGSLQELINPFYQETKVHCVIKTLGCGEETPLTEVHDMILICPVIKPNFIYLGTSQEINFNKVFVGTKAKIFFEIQNVSLERISPTVSLLNPVGPFFGSGSLIKAEVDPEHIWRQTITYAPTEVKGLEEEFFEIHCGTTNISLKVKGEAIQPQYKITPDFSCCIVETKMGNSEEIKLDIENNNAIEFRLQIVSDFIKEGLISHKNNNDKRENVDDSKGTKEKPNQKEEAKEKKKSKNPGSEKKNLKFLDEIPNEVLVELENFTDVKEESSFKVFELAGVNGSNEVIIPPFSKYPLKIKFSSPHRKKDISGDKKYAVQYKILLGKVFLIKQFLLIGLISNEK